MTSCLSWRPAVDVNRIVLGGQVVAVVTLLTIRRPSPIPLSNWRTDGGYLIHPIGTVRAHTSHGRPLTSPGVANEWIQIV